MAVRLLKTEEVAELCGGISINTLAYWRATRTGPPWAKIGRRVAYREDDVQAWVEAQFAKAAAERSA